MGGQETILPFQILFRSAWVLTTWMPFHMLSNLKFLGELKTNKFLGNLQLTLSRRSRDPQHTSCCLSLSTSMEKSNYLLGEHVSGEVMVPRFWVPWCTNFFLTLHWAIWAKLLRGGLMPSISSPARGTAGLHGFHISSSSLPTHTYSYESRALGNKKKNLLPAAEDTKNKLCQRSDWMFTFSVRIFPLMLSRSWAQGPAIVLYKIYKEMDPGLARHKSPLCPSEETALFLFLAGLFFPIPVNSGWPKPIFASSRTAGFQHCSS